MRLTEASAGLDSLPVLAASAVPVELFFPLIRKYWEFEIFPEISTTSS